jgi:hypothetical protein
VKNNKIFSDKLIVKRPRQLRRSVFTSFSSRITVRQKTSSPLLTLRRGVSGTDGVRFCRSLDLIADTLSDPDEVRCDVRFENTLLFSRWFPILRKGSFAVVAVVTDTFPQERHWIVTAYISKKITQGETIWTRN